MNLRNEDYLLVLVFRFSLIVPWPKSRLRRLIDTLRVAVALISRAMSTPCEIFMNFASVAEFA